MAQYGKNYYGASYYGISGVFSGQFTSDRTAIHDPIKPGGTVNLDIYATIPKNTYRYGDTAILVDDIAKWTIKTDSIETSDPSAMLKGYLSCSDITLEFMQRAEGADVRVDLVQYGLAGETARASYFIDTAVSSVLNITGIAYKDYVIEVRIDPAKLGGVLEFKNLSALTGDVSLEFNHTATDVEMLSGWSGFLPITLTRQHVSESSYKFTGLTGDVSGMVGYQFKILMATSDNESTPEITLLDLHTPHNDNYSDDGFWKVLLDLGSDFGSMGSDEIQTITYLGSTPGKSRIDIASRTTDDPATETQEDGNISWGYWSAPYSSAANRAIFNMADTDLEAIFANDPTALAQLDNGYLTASITSPVMTPQNLTNWSEWLPNYYIVDRDFITKESFNSTTPLGSFINIEFLNEDFTPIVVNKDPQKLTIKEQYYNIADDPVLSELFASAINKITTPLRVRVKYHIKPGHGTPAFEGMVLNSSAYYREVKRFLDFDRQENMGQIGYEAFGCAVFGDNTGRDLIYLDGRARQTTASISNLGFTIPIGAENPRYTLSQPLLDGAKASLVNLFWESQISSQSPSPRTDLQSDRLMVETIVNGTDIKMHRHRGSGITLRIEDGAGNHDSYKLSNVFYPVLNQEKMDKNLYGYYLANGYNADNTINANVDIRWSGENNLEDPPMGTLAPWLYRRYISLYPSQTVNVSIVAAGPGTINTWSSEEMIGSSTVNLNSPVLNVGDPAPRETSVVLVPPAIDKDAIAPLEKPYRVEIIDGSVTSEGQKKANNRIHIDFLEKRSQTLATIYDAKLVKSSIDRDFLFRSHTANILSINKTENKVGADYVQGIHFSIENDMIDWTIGINDPMISNETLPKSGDTLYVSFRYLPVTELHLKFSANYNRKYYDKANIYRTPALFFSGWCSPGLDFESETYDISALWPAIPEVVDNNTLMLKVKVIDNDYVNAYVDQNRVIGTLGFVNPKENWHPHIKDGFYNIGKDNFYLFTSPKKIVIGKQTVPTAENINYIEGVINQGLLIQQGTQNLFRNSSFDVNKEALAKVFKETFER